MLSQENQVHGPHSHRKENELDDVQAGVFVL